MRWQSQNILKIPHNICMHENEVHCSSTQTFYHWSSFSGYLLSKTASHPLALIRVPSLKESELLISAMNMASLRSGILDFVRAHYVFARRSLYVASGLVATAVGVYYFDVTNEKRFKLAMVCHFLCSPIGEFRMEEKGGDDGSARHPRLPWNFCARKFESLVQWNEMKALLSIGQERGGRGRAEGSERDSCRSVRAKLQIGCAKEYEKYAMPLAGDCSCCVIA